MSCRAGGRPGCGSGLGSLGVITNGSIRDLDQVAEGFQLLAAQIGPSHLWVRPVEWEVPVTVAGMLCAMQAISSAR